MRSLLTSGLLVLFLAPSAAHAQSSALPRTGYDKSWFISEFWSGETPEGFAVTRRNVTVMARSGMDKKLPRAVACRLPYLAVFHPWNKARNQKNHARFFSANKMVDLVAKENFDFVSKFYSEGPSRELRETRLPIKKGEVIQYLQYGQEGSFWVRIKGKRYVAQEDLLEHVQDSPQKERLLTTKFSTDQWVSLTCENGTRAYIYFRDVDPASKVKVPGVDSPHTISSQDVIVGDGEARDLTVREAEQIEKTPNAN